MLARLLNRRRYEQTEQNFHFSGTFTTELPALRLVDRPAAIPRPCYDGWKQHYVAERDGKMVRIDFLGYMPA